MSSASGKKGKVGATALPDHLEDIRTRVHVKAAAPSHVTGIHDSHAFDSLKFDNSFNMKSWKKNLTIKMLSKQENELVFSLVGVEAPIANAFRRILIAEIPTMAIEKINIYNNTSIIQDEVLAHRLGLVPILANPDDFKYLYECDGMSAENTLAFVLNITCSVRPDMPSTCLPSEKYENSNVYAKDIKWVPISGQEMKIKPVYDDILVAKLRPGQQIELEMFAEKGIAKTHAKWSACAASYRLLPEIRLKELSEEESQELVAKCPMKVFDIEDGHAIVARPMNCSMCRECIREPEWEQKIDLLRVRNHFIFSIESVGAIDPKTLFLKSVAELKSKCNVMLQALDHLQSQ